jgi:hypothetical protein
VREDIVSLVCAVLLDIPDLAFPICSQGFFTFNFAIYSYCGQAFVCLVENQATAVILSSVFIGLNNFFAGLVVLPQLMVGTFFAVPYYITPGHYVYEGMVTSLYKNDNSAVFADTGSAFYDWLDCTADMMVPCNGTVDDFVNFFFGGNFNVDHSKRNAFILGAVLIIARVVTYLSLKYIRFN